MDAMTPQLSLRSLAKRYANGFEALTPIDLDIGAGEFVAIVGASGCGKSTLLKIIAGLEEPTAGEILLDGQDITRLPPAAMRALRPRMQLVFQDPFASLNPRRRVGDIIADGPVTHGVPRATARAQAA